MRHRVFVAVVVAIVTAWPTAVLAQMAVQTPARAIEAQSVPHVHAPEPPASPAQAVEGLSLAELEARALAGHPMIREAAALADAARGRRRQAGVLDNPVIGVSVGELRPRESPSGVTGAFLEQMLPLGGKRGAARREAEAEVTVSETSLEAARLRVLVGVQSAYYDVVAAEERLRLADRLVTLADDSLAVAGQLFNIGMVDRPDVLQGEAEQARARAMRVGAEARQQAAWHRLAAAVGEDVIDPQPLAASVESVLPALGRDDLWRRVLDGNPELVGARAEIAKQRASTDVARRAMSPDLFLRGEAAWNREHLASFTGRERSTGWEFGIEAGFSLPVVNRNRGGIVAADASLRAAEAAEAVARLDVSSRFASTFADYESARAAVAGYRTEVLPRADEAYTLHIARYREMRASYSGVLLATQTLISMQEQYLDAFELAWRATLALEAFLVYGGK